MLTARCSPPCRNPLCCPPGSAARQLPVARTLTRGPCDHLGKQTEVRPGCGGRMCRHECDAGEPFAVPGGVCQTCPKWEPQYDPKGEHARPDLPRWHPVPMPDVRPTRDRLVITVVIGDDAEQLHAVTGPSQKRYADRLNADYTVIRGQTQDPRMVCAEKWRVKDYVPHYPGGTVYLDADVFVAPDSPDILVATPPTHIGMVDISPRMPAIIDWAEGKARELCRTQGVELAEFERKYWNSGVWVGRPAHAAYWEPPAHPYPADWCTEEIWCRLTAQRLGLPVHDLDGRFNWTWNTDRQLATVGETRPWVWHFAGMGNPQADGVAEWKQSNRVWRLALLRLLAAAAG